MKQIILTPEEKQLLTQLMDRTDRQDVMSRDSYDRRRAEIRDAIIMDCEYIPEKVLRLNSKFDFKTPNGKVSTLQLVLPKDSDINKNKLSILAPMGVAVIGHKEGDEVLWKFAAGQMRISILKVENPACETQGETVS